MVAEQEEIRCAETFKAIGDRTRLQILRTLLDSEKCVTDLAKSLHTDAPRISFHLARLKFAGLVVDQRQGQRVIYRINPDVLKSAGRGHSVIDIGCCTLDFATGK